MLDVEELRKCGVGGCTEKRFAEILDELERLNADLIEAINAWGFYHEVTTEQPQWFLNYLKANRRK